MFNTLIETFKKYKNLFQKHSFFISVLCSLAFSIYNGILGLIKHTVWNQAIFLYYLLLLIIRFTLYHNKKKDYEKPTYIVTSIILFIMNIVMIFPAILMVNGQKSVNMTLIPAIAIALYTTCKVISVIYNLCSKKKKSESLIINQMKLVRLFDAAMSVLTLQNTMIIVNQTEASSDMHLLSMVSTISILGVLMVFSVMSFITTMKKEYIVL